MYNGTSPCPHLTSKVTSSPLRSRLPSPVGDSISEVPLYYLLRGSIPRIALRNNTMLVKPGHNKLMGIAMQYGWVIISYVLDFAYNIFASMSTIARLLVFESTITLTNDIVYVVS